MQLYLGAIGIGATSKSKYYRAFLICFALKSNHVFFFFFLLCIFVGGGGYIFCKYLALIQEIVPTHFWVIFFCHFGAVKR